ncbi:DUF7146 domain-containing protein [Roseovarius indicus]|uniref:Conjugative transfer relaxase protein TraI n=1 Tax=Roseovarius indicus TaxID=540747 RepID=A0A5P3AEQ7_9RHOB|nr:toprim domain-containing protein [Roseovarius indicus]QEW27847.1 conjugative transfer relaxase protein TraI [Roseovarius indicus]SFE79322.1 Toprim domain-containing protein [Roseovarius indicus]
MPRQTYSLEEIKHMLNDRVEDVAEHYAPPRGGWYKAQGRYFTLNPGRADRTVGSFCVHLAGAKRGRWNDYAIREGGDLIDLIELSLGCTRREALAEARRFLGLSTQNPETEAQRKERQRRLDVQRRQRESDEREKQARKSKAALAIWLSGQEHLRGTPVDYYLKGRGIDLTRLGRQPGALRYLPECSYYDEDPETGEVIEAKLPAMAAIISNAKGQQVALHRTYLGLDAAGQWAKAGVRQPKKVLGQYGGAAVNLWRGIGPRGGKPASLPQCPKNTHVFVTEGIEDALSMVLLNPEARVLAAVSLGNLAQLQLPENVARITLVADLDENEDARKALHRAIAAHRAKGRDVRLWQNSFGGKDLNDALKLALVKKDEDEVGKEDEDA